ncbi:MAG: D-glycero-beta-D-manno-heptose 1-phosphate adenylyltransferase [Ignavibacteria bacterium]|nr:D-glycero-beta-D-manno-heptose 1-phosphate adenylyltransferase [Ignavibacteria bacterium]
MKRIFYTGEGLQELLRELRAEKKKIVFTNGVFDIIHMGHVEYLLEAKSMGDVLIVGLNSDSSVKMIKGDKRPIVPEVNRAFVLSNLKPVDFVVIFDEDNPFNLISNVLPDVLVKGADWSEDKIVGADVVKNNGGEIKRIKFVENNSSTNIIDKIIQLYTK